MSDLVSMGGYGAYVWGAWSISLLILAIMVWSPYRKRKQLEKQLLRQIAREIIIMQSKD
jgi:heme exporter protein CcmD